MRLTQKNEFFEYVLPCQNIVGDNQATEISLGETEYTCKKYIIGEAIKEFGELEDVLESWHIENLEELKIINKNERLKYQKLLYTYKQQIADLEAKLAESEKLTERLQQIIDKLRDKEFAGKALVEAVNAVYEPLYKNKYDEAEELKQQLAENEKYTYSGKEVGKIEQYYENLLAEKEKEIRKKVCDDVIKFMEEDGFDCSDWLDLFNLISGSN